MTQDMLALVRENEIKFVDLRFTTLLGRSMHVTVPVAELTAERMAAGFSVAGAGQDGARRLVPAAETGFVDPFCQHPTLAWICDLQDAAGQNARDDPRAVARRAEAYLAAAGIATEARFAIDVQFFVFDQVSYEQTINGAHYRVDAREGQWRRGRDEPDNLGMQLRAGEAATPLPPADSLHNLRSEMVAALAACGVPCSGHQHGPTTGGQAQLSLGPASLVRAADQLMTCKYVVRNVAVRHGKVATFLPQPLFGEPGSRLPVRLSLWKDGRSVLESGDLDQQVRGNWQRHAPSLSALTRPTTSSYRLTWPADLAEPEGRQPAGEVEFRAIDPSANPYLALPALLLAALDAGAKVEAEAPTVPTLEDALVALQADHAYLRQGDVFSEELLSRWLEAKWCEVEAVRARPHPYEFCMYFDL